jgi:hypothetical protein
MARKVFDREKREKREKKRRREASKIIDPS